MLKRYRKSFYFQLLILDAVATFLAWLLAYYVRFQILREDNEGWAITFVRLGVLAVLLNWIFFHVNRLYQPLRIQPWYKEVLSIFGAILQGTIAIIVLYYFFASIRFSRGHLLMYLVFCELLVVLFRVFYRNHLYAMYWKGKLLHPILLVGNGPQMDRYVSLVKNAPDLGYRFIGWIDSNKKALHFDIPEIPADDLVKLIDQYHPELVVIGYSHDQTAKIESMLEASYNTVTPLVLLPDLSYDFIGSTVEDFLGIPLIKINQPQERFFSGLAKRFMDIVFSFIGLIILSPLFLIIAILIKLTSKGPVFYKQERMTMDGDRFYMVKFRSMRVLNDGSNEKGWTVKDDPRITPIGAFLRKTSLDEFPQLWNVLKGEMSLVGPRPERPMYVEQFKVKIPAYMLRHRVKGGITGWAQVNGWRGDTSIEKRLEYDLYYIRNWSLWFDIKILFLTFIKGFVNKNAY
jgi:exopolysaccharide biosynthesis polyprenyl glycosylphosphotransferase